MRLIAAVLFTASFAAAEKLPVPALVKLAESARPAEHFRTALVDTLGAEEISKGTAVASQGPDFIWAVEATDTPALFVDDMATPAMKRVSNSNIWYSTARLVTGTSHRFRYLIGGKDFGGRTDVPAYGPESYEQPGVRQGTLSDRLTHTSKIYEGMVSNYWIYVPAQYNPATPAALMVWQDGEKLIDRNGPRRLLTAVDNLIHQRKMPVTILVLISPGTVADKAMRSIEYDTVSDRYGRFLRDELLPEVYSKYNIRRDGYSRAIAGESSGGICSFNAAWQQPDQFSRVISWIGSFTSIQWDRQGLGGQDFPFLVRKTPRKNIRVWLQDGSEDLENTHGSWPLQNIQMANSLKMQEYDFHFSFGNGTHNSAHGSAELPAELTWLWRGYDTAKTEETYVMDPLEKNQPFYRVKTYNRDLSRSDPR